MPRLAAGTEEEGRVRSFVWFVLGIAGGFVLAHVVDRDPRGHEVLGQLDARIAEFTDRIGDAYRAQEAQLSEAVDEPVDAAASAPRPLTD